MHNMVIWCPKDPSPVETWGSATTFLSSSLQESFFSCRCSFCAYQQETYDHFPDTKCLQIITNEVYLLYKLGVVKPNAGKLTAEKFFVKYI
jgi:hypothetical protein